MNKYSNGNEYFGYYRNDLRNKQGIYIYKPKTILQKFNIKTILFQFVGK